MKILRRSVFLYILISLSTFFSYCQENLAPVHQKKLYDARIQLYKPLIKLLSLLETDLEAIEREEENGNDLKYKSERKRPKDPDPINVLRTRKRVDWTSLLTTRSTGGSGPIQPVSAISPVYFRNRPQIDYSDQEETKLRKSSAEPVEVSRISAGTKLFEKWTTQEIARVIIEESNDSEVLSNSNVQLIIEIINQKLKSRYLDYIISSKTVLHVAKNRLSELLEILDSTPVEQRHSLLFDISG